MTYERFLKVILTLQKQNKVVNKAYKIGFDIMDFTDSYHGVINELIKECYGEDGFNWWDWYCWENNFGQKGFGAWDENQNPICYSHESLWEYLESNL